jgi:hypothetical protein
MKIGRSNNRTLQTANNQGMARRVDNRVNATVDAYAARFKTALAVDGAVAFIFNKHNGITPCTCRGFINYNNVMSHEVGITGMETSRDEVKQDLSNNSRHAGVFDNSKIRQVGGLRPSDLDDHFRGRNETIVEKISNKFTEADEDQFLEENSFTDDSSDDIVDAMFGGYTEAPIMGGDGDPMKKILDATRLGNSTDHAFTSNFVACPICMGSGYVDSWRLYNGERIVLDASEKYKIEIYNDVEIDTTAQPATYSVYERSHIEWQNVGLPLSWRHLMRLAVFNGGKELAPDSYRLYYVHPSQPNTRNPLDFQALALLSNHALLRLGNKVKIILESAMGPRYPLVFTHVEMMFSLGEVVRIQIPDMEIANEDEFADYNLNSNFELPSDVEIKENSYLVEGKYTRTWKVTQVNRKLTSRGISFGYAVAVRALHSFERQFFLFNILGKPRNPFDNSNIRDMDGEDY